MKEAHGCLRRKGKINLFESVTGTHSRTTFNNTPNTLLRLCTLQYNYSFQSPWFTLFDDTSHSQERYKTGVHFLLPFKFFWAFDINYIFPILRTTKSKINTYFVTRIFFFPYYCYSLGYHKKGKTKKDSESNRFRRVVSTCS